MKLSDHGTVLRTRKVFEVRSMTREDLAVLEEPRVPVAAVKRLRDPHHRLARMLAIGVKPGMAAARCGYSNSRVSMLLADPAFKDLVTKYQNDLDSTIAEAEDDYIELTRTNMLKAERMLSDKLDEADEHEESLPVRDLIAISRDAADRLGYGKTHLNLNANVDFAKQLEGAITRSANVRLVNATPEASRPSPPLAPSSSPQSASNSGAPSPRLLIQRRA